MKILLLSRYTSLGVTSRIRFYQYIPYLKENGIDVTVAPFHNDAFIHALYTGSRKHLMGILTSYFRRIGYLLNARRFDLLWIEKEILPWAPAWIEWILLRVNIPVVVDYDDPLFHKYDMHPSCIVRALFGTKIDAIMRRADLVIAGNEYLADRARKAGARRVEQLPTVIDLNRYIVREPREHSGFTIGWIGNPLTSRYLHLIQPALREVSRTGNTSLLLVGSGPVELDGLPVAIRTWSEETEVADIQSFDVGIMPLPDEPWERGKCGYKLIQYLACARPAVASPVGVNRQIIEHGENGFFASATKEWVQALGLLRDDSDLRRRMGRAGRSKVETQYCLQLTASRMLQLLRDVS